MKKVNKLLHLVLGFSAGVLAGAFIRLGFEIIDGRPAAIGGEALILPLVILLVGFGFALGKEVKVNTTRVSNFFIGTRVVSYSESLALQGFPLFINNPDAS